MSDHKPLLVVPNTSNLSRAFDGDLAEIGASERAHRTGVVLLAPLGTSPAAVIVACHMWPYVLRPLRVRRLAVVLGAKSYLSAEPVLPRCVRALKLQGVKAAYFHEGHLESDHIRAWFERRKPRGRVRSESLVELSKRYVARDDHSGAFFAMELAHALAG